jgi:anti-sigma factor RsiW
MTHDDPNFTAYLLGELCDADRLQIADLLETDPAAAKLADQTALIADILTTHFARPVRRRFVPTALAASLLIVAATLSLLCRSANGPTAQIVAAGPVAHAASRTTVNQSLSFADAPAMEVEQFVAGVLADASRLNSFSSLRLTSDPLASDLPASFH